MSQSYKELIAEKIENNEQWLLLYKAANDPTKEIHFCGNDDEVWQQVDKPLFRYTREHYRIKDKPIEYWINFYKNGYSKYYITEEHAIYEATELNEDLIRAAIHMNRKYNVINL